MFYQKDIENMVVSVLWVLLMLLFTYTDCFVVLVTKDSDFIREYSIHQSSIISLVVNFGLVLMLIFDYVRACEVADKYMYLPFGISLLMAIGIYTHCTINANGRLVDFVFPISWKYLGVFLHLMFIILMIGMKYVCLSKESKIKKIEEV